MEADTKQKLQIAMAVVTVIAVVNTARIFYERRQSDGPAKPDVVENRNLDDYVYLRPSHAHDLKSSSEALSGKTVWVRAGNSVAYYPYDQPSHKPMPHESALLPPMAELQVKDVVMSSTQMYAVFTFAPDRKAAGVQVRPGPQVLFAAPIGAVKHGETAIFVDDIFFLEDPHKLYKHWSAETWSAVERHEIRKGMSEIQASAAMGVGRAVSGSSGEYGNRTLEFMDVASGKTVTVTFFKNYASTILEVTQTPAP
jgi:hypothetical protein